jgi:hypothetical protein
VKGKEISAVVHNVCGDRPGSNFLKDRHAT